MLGEFPGDTWHVSWAPCEDAPMLPEELDEHAFLCLREADAHNDFMSGVTVVEPNASSGRRSFKLRRRGAQRDGLLQDGGVVRVDPAGVLGECLRLVHLLSNDCVGHPATLGLALDHHSRIAVYADGSIWARDLHRFVGVVVRRHEPS